MNEELMERILNKLNAIEGQLQQVSSKVDSAQQEINKLSEKWKEYTMDDVVSRLKHVNITLNSIEAAMDEVTQNQAIKAITGIECLLHF
ncbi:hypothetical protein D770_21915 [Flammeovirgaceae bacterium 311]|nr:hypothetical protein D770_21915 [Flammeovirgaceae bacterium 311]